MWEFCGILINTYHFTPDISKWPGGPDIIGSSKWHAKYHKQNVGRSQVDDKQVCCGTHLFVGRDDCWYKDLLLIY